MERIKTNDQYEKTINENKVTIIKYEATWCPDCKRLDHFIGDIMAEHQDKKWLELNIEDLPEITELNEVRGIPSLLVYKNGEKLAHLHSANTKNPGEVKEFLKQFK
ncbi:thioredoxin family protein [Pseudalkalibacillus caeni]|uniref:Thioredoxin family protein n=1 Tax=Exobacillus caeni TaxID=2574798 RepID=A0A5R9F1T7_9BACL|nr:thioredoxin family protein [Pseudalkalibacillus caeni]TLS37592.1 thioredoxin family protein [Pseudalkalibacillus caeni]